MSFDDAVALLDQTEVIALVTTRSDGTPAAVPIWSMVLEGVPYLRSVRGSNAWWYRHVVAGRSVAVAVGDGAIAETDRAAALALPREPLSLVPIPADDPINDAIDAEIRRKYAADPASVDAMLRDLARAHTFRVERPQL